MSGDELRKVREAAGLTQEQLASKLGVHKTYIYLLEKGKQPLTMDMALRILAAVHGWPGKVGRLGNVGRSANVRRSESARERRVLTYEVKYVRPDNQPRGPQCV